jgi:transposase
MYSLDIRKLACRLYEKFKSLRKTATILEISHTTIARWLNRLEIKKYFRKPKICSDHVIETIRTSLMVNPFITTRKLVVKIKEVCKVDVSRELIRVAISKLGYTKKKAKFMSCPKNLQEKTTIFKNLRNQFIHEKGPSFH